MSFITASVNFRKTIEKIVEFLWLGIVFIVPLIFIPNIFTTFELAKVVVFKILVAAMMLIWVLKGLFIGKSPVLKFSQENDNGWSFIFLGGFIVFFAIATLFSFAPALSVFGWYPRFQGFYTMFFYLVFGGIVFFEIRNSSQRESVIKVLMASFLTICSFALFQKFLPLSLQFWNDAEFHGRLYGTLANPNYLAGFIVMILPVIFSNFLRKKHLIFSVICAIAGCITLLFTLSRAGFIAFILSSVFLYGVVAYQRKWKKTLVTLILIPIISGLFVGYVILHPQDQWIQNTPFLQRLTLDENNMSSTRSRFEIWSGVLKLIASSPMIGYGPETFAITFPAFAPSTVNTQEDQGEIADHAHNELLDIAAQIGIPGALCYFGFILSLIFLAVTKNTQWPQASEDDYSLMTGFASGVLALFIANQFGFSVTVHWVYLALFAAIILNSHHRDSITEVSFKIHKVWKIFIFLSIAIVSIGMFWIHDASMIIADYHMRNAYNGIIDSQIGIAIDTHGFTSEILQKVGIIEKEFQSAVRWAPNESFYALNSSHFILGELFAGQKFSSVEIVSAISDVLQASRLRGYDGFSLSVYSELKKFSGLTF